MHYLNFEIALFAIHYCVHFMPINYLLYIIIVWYYLKFRKCLPLAHFLLQLVITNFTSKVENLV